MIDFGTRQRCENCEYGHAYYDKKMKPVEADCRRFKFKINRKDFETFNCMYFKKKEEVKEK